MILKKTGLFLSVLLLGACANLTSTQPTSSLYFLNPALIDGQTKELNKSIEVVRPSLAPGLDGERIVLVRNARELNYYATIKWAAPLDKLIADAVIQSFEEKYSGVDVGLRPLDPSPDYRLVIKVKDFQSEYTAGKNTPDLNVHISAALLSLPDQKVLTHVRIKERAPAKANSGTEIVGVLEALTARAIQRIFETMEPILISKKSL